MAIRMKVDSVTYRAGSAVALLRKAGLDKTLWGERTIQAEQTGSFTVADKAAASVWGTCPCGKLAGVRQLVTSEKHEAGPADRRLNKLGQLFRADVMEDNHGQAARTLILIEQEAERVRTQDGTGEL